MWKRPLESVGSNLVARIQDLAEMGCDILRFSVPKIETAEILGKLSALVATPLVADIHFDHRIALRCMDFPIAKIRINPGNIGAVWKVEELLRKAKDHRVPIRIGINGGSLPKNLAGEKDRGAAMVKAAEREIELLDKLGFRSAVFSLKSSEIEETVQANRIFAERYPFPIHLGITEAGPSIPGIVRSTVALSMLLREGIGDTLRVSLSDAPENEVIAGHEILKVWGMGRGKIRIISCPTCGRTDFDVQEFLKKAYPFLLRQKKDLTVAIMGCPVNGPGEAKRADIGITGSSRYAVLFKEGKIIRRVRTEEAFEAFKEEILRAETG
jgi:(E)-4-hydroxy-3-methylbut-2-enyl-diphosphate synthase